MAMQSKPGPMFAIDAGTFTRMTSQLQDLSECAGVSVELDGRFDVLQRGVGVLEARTGQDDHRRRVLLDLAVPPQPEEAGERSRPCRLGPQPVAACQPPLAGARLGA